MPKQIPGALTHERNEWVSALDHVEFGSNQPEFKNVIDSKSLERVAGGKPLRTFPEPALGAADEFAPSVAGPDPVSADQADRRSSLSARDGSVRDGPIHDEADGMGAGAEARRGSLTPERLDEITKGLRYRQSGRVVAALWPLAQQYGMSRLARDTGISREHLYRIFGDATNLKFDTLLSLLHVLGIKLSADIFFVTSE